MNSAAISTGRSGARPAAMGSSAAPVPAATAVALLPARSMTRLASVTRATRPIGAASRATPSMPSDSCRLCLIAGILASQPPDARPSTAKKATTATR